MLHVRFSRFGIATVLVAGASVALTGSGSNQRVEAAGEASSSPYCHSGDPLRGVYLPGRFTLHSRCMVVSGTVTALAREADGDYHIQVSGVNRKLLRPANGGHLVLERVPAFPIRLPAVGSRVTVVGPYVTDNFVNHGWNEIHPTWHIAVRSGRQISSQEATRIPLDPNPPDPEDDK